eukprot:Gregarina_sp_Poly_1__3198@NODE_190_length_11648_cov_127_353855_g169_i0_p5_GENE_NODE_190_length_11648_cov_127_353855_g169_i0NODE_190_length_11648_cov_127_353855_g169_i0_p5_ORF_typecomplete_len273_score21_05_NODE_190_length_11648_cov_127_353855_g169_i077198537
MAKLSRKTSSVHTSKRGLNWRLQDRVRSKSEPLLVSLAATVSETTRFATSNSGKNNKTSRHSAPPSIQSGAHKRSVFPLAPIWRRSKSLSIVDHSAQCMHEPLTPVRCRGVSLPNVLSPMSTGSIAEIDRHVYRDARSSQRSTRREAELEFAPTSSFLNLTEETPKNCNIYFHRTTEGDQLNEDAPALSVAEDGEQQSAHVSSSLSTPGSSPDVSSSNESRSETAAEECMTGCANFEAEERRHPISPSPNFFSLLLFSPRTGQQNDPSKSPK